jgi:serine/threonine protein kinase/tetratricopeptide (TPR) repeat protein
MSAGGERKPDDLENQTPPNLESGSSRQSEAKYEVTRPGTARAGEPDLSRRSPAAAGEAEADTSGATEGLPPNRPLPPGAEMLRQASGSSMDSFSDEAADLSLLVAEHFQRRYAHFEVEIGPDGKPVELGRGAMGITYKASDTTLRRPVALKVISSRLLHNESLKNRFLREARAAASLRHPFVASIYYLGSTEASYFYAMELIEGQTLEAFIAQHGPLDMKLALEITAQIASALAAAHQAGLVHRDIKPANIILARDSHGQLTAKVIDFGLVKFATGDIEESSASEPGIFLGTPRYASPEQISCGPVDIRSDLYSVGVTLWQMLTKSAPFIGTPSEVAAQHLQAPLPISKLKYFPQPVVALLTHLLEKDPKDRPQTPEDLLAVLRATQRSLAGTRAGPLHLPPVKADSQSGFRLSKLYLLVGGCGLLLAMVTGGYFLWQPRPLTVNDTGKSIAVLPFDNVGDDKQNQYLSDGLTTEVIFQLSQIGDLRVVSRDSVLAFKAAPGVPRKSLQDIGKDLNVDTVLESSIQRLNDQVKIIAVLYATKTGKRIWGAAYNREMKDLFVIQADVAENIAAALKVRLSPDELQEIKKKPTENVTAYDLYLQGREFYDLRHKEDNEKAIALFRQAVELDPKFALGYVGLANCYIERVDRFGGETFLLDSAIDLCEQAITLDSGQVRAYTVLSRAFSFKGMDSQAHEQTMRALALAPNDASANRRAAYDADALGHVSDQYRLGLRLHVLEPNDPWQPYNLAEVCAWVGDSGQMEKWMDVALNLEPDSQRRAVLQCERLVYRRDWENAAASLRKLPADLKAYNHPAFELLAAVAAKLHDWQTVDEIAQTKLGNQGDVWDQKFWSLAYLALSAKNNHKESEMRERSQSLVSYIQEKSAGRSIQEWEAFYFAFGERLLENKNLAYEHLQGVFSPVVRHLPLMEQDPLLSVFEDDTEYRTLLATLQQEREKTKATIRNAGKGD